MQVQSKADCIPSSIEKIAKLLIGVTMLMLLLPSPANAACPNWSSRQYYNVNDVVQYRGQNYIALHENPGYNPMVSTWYWKQTSSTCGTTSTPVAASCSAWVNGKQYKVNDIVQYKGSNYIAVHDNPGYNPAISTWYWDPTSASCKGTGSTSGGSTSGGSTSSGSAACPAWVDGTWYKAGDVVLYNGRNYIAKYENPGYTPTISTWYWSTTTQKCSTASNGNSNTGGTSGGSNNSGGNTSGNTGQDCGTKWYSANLTNYTSYPDPGSEECLEYNGCTWAGQFYGLSNKQSESWVKANNIVAVHMKDWSWMGMKTVRLRQGSKEITATVYDACSDSDCSGCCTNNLGGDGYLIDVEKYTMQRFGSGEGTVQFQVCN